MNPQDDLLWQRMHVRQEVARLKCDVIFKSRTSDEDPSVNTAVLDYVAERECAYHDYLAAKLAEVAHV